MSDSTTIVSPSPTQGAEWFGHPRGLFYLFFAEMWERFCYYGMRAILILYMVHYFSYGDERASGVYGAYIGLVYLPGIFGGYIADRFLGYRRAIIFGGIVMAIGEFALLVNSQTMGMIGLPLSDRVQDLLFFGGMATIIVGNGFFKPNISTIVGKLYAVDDPRRDAAFTIFYMGINIGALVSGLLCGWIGENFGWNYGFGLAGIGMLFGVATFVVGNKHFQGHGEARSEESARRAFPKVVVGSLLAIPLFGYLLHQNELLRYLLYPMFGIGIGILLKVAFGEAREQRERIFALLVLLCFNVAFWMFFEQAGSSLTLFAERNLDRGIFGWMMPASWAQQFNPAFIILLAPFFAMLWMRLNHRGKEPSIPAKFTLGMLQIALAFEIIVIGASYFSTDGITPLIFIVLLYLFQTTGELCLSPVGLSMVTKLAPERMTGMVMGMWFLSIAVADYLAGEIAKLTSAAGGESGGAALPPAESLSIYGDVYQTGAYILAGAGILLFLLVPLLRKWMHGVK